jgi:hypothetical protein
MKRVLIRLRGLRRERSKGSVAAERGQRVRPERSVAKERRRKRRVILQRRKRRPAVATVKRRRLRGRVVRKGRERPAATRRSAVVGGRSGREAAAAAHGRRRVSRKRVGLAHIVGLLTGGGTAVSLVVLASLPGAAAQSRATADRAPLVTLAVSDEMALPPKPARATAKRHRPHRGGRDYYRKTTSRHVPTAAEAGYLPLYREAARAFGVSWRLIASIHRQETAFSTVPGIYHGLNAFGCCAGPMQFNVTNGPVSTWDRYRESFRLGHRPHHYPHPTRGHPSVYDDFDAIMAAAALLRDSGATDLLDGGAWSAAYAYYGHDAFGVGYADQVVARAQGWEISGFCVNCPTDDALISQLDDAYGVAARQALPAAGKHKKHKHHKKKPAGDASGQDGSEQPPALADPTPDPTVTTPAPATDTTTTTTPTTTTPAPPVTTTPAAPPPKACTPVTRLLGCRN